MAEETRPAYVARRTFMLRDVDPDTGRRTHRVVSRGTELAADDPALEDLLAQRKVALTDVPVAQPGPE